MLVHKWDSFVKPVIYGDNCNKFLTVVFHVCACYAIMLKVLYVLETDAFSIPIIVLRAKSNFH